MYLGTVDKLLLEEQQIYIYSLLREQNESVLL